MSARRSKLLGAVGWVGITYLTAAVGAIASAGAQGFYAQLERPPWAPPASVFAPVWTVLYGLMALAVWLVWQERGWRSGRLELGLYVAQLAANALWTWLFFAWRLGAASFVEIVVLWLLVAATLAAFWRVRPLAGAMLSPYLAWVSFAAALNLSVWQRNPTLLG